MKALILSITFIIVHTLSFSQTTNWRWARGAGGSTNDQAMDIAVHSNGNSYTTGYFSSDSVNFGSISIKRNGAFQFILAKHDSSGNVVWVRTSSTGYTTEGYSLGVDSLENIYVCGKYLTDAVFGNDTLLGSLSRHHTFILKYDSGGNLIWSIRGQGNEEDVPTDLCVDNSGNIYITGWFSSDTLKFGNYLVPKIGGKNNLYTIKMNSSGSIVWAHNVGPSNSIISKSISIDKFGNCFVTGYFDDVSITIGSSTLYNNDIVLNTTDIFIVKYNSSGNVQWAKKAGGNSEDEAHSIAVENNGNFYITGVSLSDTQEYGNVLIKAVSDTINRSSFQDAFVAKYDGDGNCLWARSEGGGGIDKSRAVAIDIEQNSYVFMESTGGIGMFRIIDGQMLNTTAQAFVICRDSIGKLRWIQEVEGDIWGNSIAVDGSKSSFIAGGYWSNSYWGNDTLNFRGVVDFYLAKIGWVTPLEVISPVINSPRIKVYPNPTKGIFSVLTDMHNSNIKVVNISGYCVLEAKFYDRISTIDMTSYAKGLYFVIVENDNQYSVEKMILE